jgi:hypothetical protein
MPIRFQQLTPIKGPKFKHQTSRTPTKAIKTETHLRMLVCDWLHFVWQKHFYVMLLHNQGCRLFQSLHFRNVIPEIQKDYVQIPS